VPSRPEITKSKVLYLKVLLANLASQALYFRFPPKHAPAETLFTLVTWHLNSLCPVGGWAEVSLYLKCKDWVSRSVYFEYHRALDWSKCMIYFSCLDFCIVKCIWYNRNIVLLYSDRAIDGYKQTDLMTDSVLKQILNLSILVLSVIKLKTELMQFLVLRE
jgi:hypothetical protein